MSLPKSAGEPGSAVAPHSASRAFVLGSARAALTSMLSLSTNSTGVLRGAPMPVVKPLVDLVRPAIDGGLQSAFEQAALKVGSARVHDLQLDAGVLRLQVRQESDEIAGTDRAHDSEFQRRALELEETRGKPLRLLRLPQNLFEIGTHRLAKLAQMRSRPLAVEEEPAELVLQQLDGARERRLRHVAFLCRPGEVQLLAQGEKYLT